MSLIYPIRYYYRKGDSDKDFILVRMAHIPPSRQKEVSDQYDRLYTREGRGPANRYLHEEAKVYRDKLKSRYNK